MNLRPSPRVLALAAWLGLAVASAYCLTLTALGLALDPHRVGELLAAGSFGHWPAGLFLRAAAPPFALALALGFVALGGAGTALGAAGASPLRRVLFVNLPLLLTPFALAQDDAVRRPSLYALALGAAAGLAVLLGRGPATDDPHPGAGAGVREHAPILALMAAHAIAFTYLAVLRDRALWSATVDLGIFKEALWNTLHGRVMHSTTVGYSFLGEHFSPVLFLLVPLYAVWPTSACLLTVQTLAITAAAWPVYRLGRELALGRPLATALAAAMLFSPPMQGALLYDFHMDLLAVPALAWLLLAAHRRAWLQMGVATALMLSVKEDMFVPAAGVVASLLLAGEKRDRRAAVVLGLCVAAYTALAIAVLLPRFGPPPGVPVYMSDGSAAGGYKFLRNFRHLAGPGGPARFLLGEPVRFVLYALTDARLTTLLTFVAPLALLPLAAGRRLPVLAPLGIILLSDNPEIVALRYHYAAIQHPGVYVAAAYGAANLARWAGATPGSGPRLAGALAALVCVAAVVMFATHPTSVASPVHGSDPHASTAHVAAVDRLVARVPEGAPVTASSFVGPRLSNRPYIGLFPHGVDRSRWALVDLQRPPWPASVAIRDTFVLRMLRADWGAVAWEDGAVLMQRGAPQGRNADAVRDLFARRRYEVEGTEQTDFPGAVERDARASDGRARVVRPTDPRPPGFVVYGPFLTLPPGAYRVRFRLRATPAAFRGESLGFVDVHAANDATLASQELYPDEFPTRAWRDVALTFTSNGNENVEFRVRTTKRWTLAADVVTLEVVGDEAAAVRAFLDAR